MDRLSGLETGPEGSFDFLSLREYRARLEAQSYIFLMVQFSETKTKEPC
jgi:hypothetical protein